MEIILRIGLINNLNIINFRNKITQWIKFINIQKKSTCNSTFGINLFLKNYIF